MTITALVAVDVFDPEADQRLPRMKLKNLLKRGRCKDAIKLSQWVVGFLVRIYSYLL
jgi:hypothetical protein